MSRQPRFLLAGQAHLVQQQGHNGVVIASDEQDRRQWLALLRDAVATHQIALHAWALEPCEFRLLLTPADASSLSRMMQTLGRRYVGWFNARHGRTGTLWDGRYRSCMVEPGSWVLDALRLVEAPEGLPPTATQADYAIAPWSSLAHHLGAVTDSSVADCKPYWALGNTPFERQAAWRRILEQPVSVRTKRAAESSLRSGRPLASANFLFEAEKSSSRRLTARPRGRPAKQGPKEPAA